MFYCQDCKLTLLDRTEQIGHDPWKLIVAVCLLNKTRGALSIPVFWRLLERHPRPEDMASGPSQPYLCFSRPTGSHLHICTADVAELTALTSSLGFRQPTYKLGSQPAPDPLPNSENTRAATLVEMSRRYCQDPPIVGVPRTKKGLRRATPISHLPGVGDYALDSFLIFSPSLVGGGAPSRVAEVLHSRALLLAARGRPPGREADDMLVLPENWLDEAWRSVVPRDKELRRYLVWRWAIEGVCWDAERGGIVGPLRRPWAVDPAKQEDFELPED